MLVTPMPPHESPTMPKGGADDTAAASALRDGHPKGTNNAAQPADDKGPAKAARGAIAGSPSLPSQLPMPQRPPPSSNGADIRDVPGDSLLLRKGSGSSSLSSSSCSSLKPQEARKLAGQISREAMAIAAAGDDDDADGAVDAGADEQPANGANNGHRERDGDVGVALAAARHSLRVADDLRRRNAALEEELRALRERNEAENAALRARLREAELSDARHREALRHFASEAARSARTRGDLLIRLAERNHDAEQAKAKTKKLEKKLEDKSQVCESLSEDKSELEAKLGHLETVGDQLHASLQGVMAENDELRGELRSLRNEKTDFSRRLDAAESLLRRLDPSRRHTCAGNGLEALWRGILVFGRQHRSLVEGKKSIGAPSGDSSVGTIATAPEEEEAEGNDDQESAKLTSPRTEPNGGDDAGQGEGDKKGGCSRVSQ